MGGRFGKYGNHKRRKALQRSQRAKSMRKGADRDTHRGQSNPLPAVRLSSSASIAKTYKTALVAIPPDFLWPPIQALRKQYDRHYRRWMPHITLLYPFRPVSFFERLTPLLVQACAGIEPFEVQLARFDLFVHSRRKTTLHLVPEPVKVLKALHNTLWKILPDCDDLRRFANGFTPHLSVGQVRSQDARALWAGWQATWEPLVFTLTKVCMIWRNDPPDDIFRIGPELAIGRYGNNSP